MEKKAEDKGDLILDAAVRRFAHFGIQKTTMQDIAADLLLSKQSIYYYFPDKQSLVKAVIQKIMEEYLDAVGAALGQVDFNEDGLLQLLEARKDLMKKYSMLFVDIGHPSNILNPSDFQAFKEESELKERRLLAVWLQKGVDGDWLRSVDTGKVATMIQEVLEALFCSIRDKTTIPDDDMFKMVYQRQKEFLQIFFEGLKSQSACRN